MGSRTWMNLEELRARKAQVGLVAEGVLNGSIGIIEGCRKLASLGHQLSPDAVADKDFVIFVALASETDHLDVGEQRVLWNPEALARQDREVARFEAAARDDVIRACRSVLERFTE